MSSLCIELYFHFTFHLCTDRDAAHLPRNVVIRRAQTLCICIRNVSSAVRIVMAIVPYTSPIWMSRRWPPLFAAHNIPTAAAVIASMLIKMFTIPLVRERIAHWIRFVSVLFQSVAGECSHLWQGVMYFYDSGLVIVLGSQRPPNFVFRLHNIYIMKLSVVAFKPQYLRLH